MSILDKIFSVATGGLVDIAGGILGSIFPNKEEEQKNQNAAMQITTAFQLKLAQLKQESETLIIEDNKSLRQQIMVELQSQDAYVRRARPTFMYIIYLVVLFNYILMPVYFIINQLVAGLPAISYEPIVLPVELWTVFGASYIGYGYFRMKDKQGEKTKGKIPLLGKIG